MLRSFDAHLPRPECLVIIPALNEGQTLGAVLEELAALSPRPEVLVIDDGSSDATAAVARRHGVHLVSHPFNLGYGAALQTGYKFAARLGAEFLVQMDADGQHSAADVPKLLQPLRAGEADISLGSRFKAESGYQMTPLRRLGREALRALLAVCGGPRVEDPTSGFQGYTRSVFEFCCGEFYPTDFPDIDVLLMLHRQGFRIVEVPVRMEPSPPARVSMHAGLRVFYYAYKMMLSTLRSAVTPRREWPRRNP